MTKPFTGWHMTAILAAFFGVVIAVNFTMARFAVSTFGGTVVDNSYVASQKFNSWLAKARQQDELGWAITLSLSPGRAVLISARRHGQTPSAMSASGTAVHPLGRTAPIPLHFSASADGMLISRQTLPPGRWLVRTAVREANGQARAESSLK